MEGMSLFKMANVDYTRFITMPSYKVISEPVTEEYTDINKISHAQYIRDKISGSFTLKFYDDSAYEDVETTKTAAENFQDFFDAYQTHRQPNGDITIEVYVNNLNALSAKRTVPALRRRSPARRRRRACNAL